MSTSFNNKDIEFTCPKCKRKVKKTVGFLKQSGQTCPHCGSKFETIAFRRGVENAEREIDRFKRDIGKMKINITL